MNGTDGAQRELVSFRGQLLLGDVLIPGSVVVADGRIVEVHRGSSGDTPGSVFEAAIIAPGYIDIQVNGGFGVEVDLSGDAYRLLSERLPERGVTAYLPTAISSPMPFYRPLIECFRRVAGENMEGARALGLHLEGPLLSPVRKGAHRQGAIEAASPDGLLEAIGDGAGVRLVTLAPERPGALRYLQCLRECGIVVSLGHTDATYDEFERGVDVGATLATHLYNAMRPFGHREPGPIGAALTDDRISTSLIADGHHAHPAAVGLAIRAKGVDRSILISDMISAAGMPAGTYELGGQSIVVDGETSRLPDGTLAGVIATIDECVRNIVAWGLASIPDAIRMATDNPARLLGETKKGRIVEGFDADLVLLDEVLTVQSTWVGGRCVYGAPSSAA